jgi:hypothetical protein
VIGTGPKPTALDEFGNQRNTVVGVGSGFKELGSTWRDCEGKVRHTSELLGKSYFVSESSAANNAINNLVRDCLHPTIRPMGMYI